MSHQCFQSVSNVLRATWKQGRVVFNAAYFDREGGVLGFSCLPFLVPFIGLATRQAFNGTKLFEPLVEFSCSPIIPAVLEARINDDGRQSDSLQR